MSWPVDLFGDRLPRGSSQGQPELAGSVPSRRGVGSSAVHRLMQRDSAAATALVRSVQQPRTVSAKPQWRRNLDALIAECHHDRRAEKFSMTKRKHFFNELSVKSQQQKFLAAKGMGPKPQLSAKEQKAIKQVFEALDQDGSGYLDAQELLQAFRCVGLRVSYEEVVELMRPVGKKGELNLDEFIQMMTIAKLGTPAGLGKDSKGDYDEVMHRNTCLMDSFPVMAQTFTTRVLVEEVLAKRERNSNTQ